MRLHSRWAQTESIYAKRLANSIRDFERNRGTSVLRLTTTIATTHSIFLISLNIQNFSSKAKNHRHA